VFTADHVTLEEAPNLREVIRLMGVMIDLYWRATQRRRSQ
jgi:hypothetical protein